MAGVSDIRPAGFLALFLDDVSAIVGIDRDGRLERVRGLHHFAQFCRVGLHLGHVAFQVFILAAIVRLDYRAIESDDYQVVDIRRADADAFVSHADRVADSVVFFE